MKTMSRPTDTELEVYYDKDGVVVRDSCASDIAYLRNNLKQSDVDEVWASHHKTPYEALLEGYENSDQCLTVAKDGRAFAMFGIVPIAAGSVNDDCAIIWFLSGEELFRIKRFEFIRHSAGFVGFFFHRAPELKRFFNFVDVRNKISVRWLKKIGATIHDPMPFGTEGLPFHYFEFRRPDDV